MAIADGNSVTLDSDDVSDWVALAVGRNRILLKGSNDVDMRVALEYSDNGTDAYSFADYSNLVPGMAIDIDGITGYIRMRAARYEAGETEMIVLNAVTDRL